MTGAISDNREASVVRLSIGTKLVVIFLALAIIPMSAVTFYNLIQGRKEVIKLASNELIRLSHSTSYSIDQLLIENQLNSAMLAGDPLTVQFMAASEQDRRELHPQLNKMLENFADTHPDYDTPGLLDANGIVVAALEETLMGKDRSFRNYFRASIKGKAYVSDILVGRGTGRPGVFLTNPVISDEGEIIGIVILWLKADTIWRIIDNVKVGREGNAYLIDQDGVIIAHSNRKLLYHSLGKLSPEAISAISSNKRFGTIQGTNKPVVPKALGLDTLLDRISLTQEAGTHYYSSSLNHSSHVAGYSYLKKQPWTVVIDLPETQFMAPLNRIKTVAYISIVLVAVIIVLISLFIAKSITNPIRRLTQVSVDVKHDRHFHPSNIEDIMTGNDEIAYLGRVFSGMVLSLREGEERFRSLVESSSDFIWEVNEEGVYSYASPQVEAILGYRPAELVGKRPFDTMAAEEGERISGLFKELVETGKPIVTIENVNLHKDGHHIVLETSGTPILDETGKVIGFRGIDRDITDRKKAEVELRNLRNYLANIIGSMPSMLIGVDTETQVTLWNRTAEQITGISAQDAQGKSFASVLPRMASEMEKIRASIQTREIKREQRRAGPLDGETYYEDLTIYPLITNGVDGAVIRIDDVTEQVRLEEMMIQSEKMLSIGGLAAGMAHEINNPLAGMMQTANVMANRLGGKIDIPASQRAAEDAGTTTGAIRDFMEARGIQRMLATINESGQRVAAIVDNMLSFARKSGSQFSSYDLGELLDKTLKLAATDYDLKKQYDFKAIEVRKEYETGMPLVNCEGSKIRQVLLNLFRNGGQAMQEAGTDKPLFTVRTSFAEDHKMATMEIEDNGPGMDEETRKRVFEPFFTTKPAGVGTGLGLSVSYYIITENHGGEMVVESQPGRGAKFIIRLPLERKVL